MDMKTAETMNYKPMVWSEFKNMTWDDQNEYIGFLQKKFGATGTAMAAMFGITSPTLSYYCKSKQFTYKFNRLVPMTEKGAVMFKEFCKPIRPHIEVKYSPQSSRSIANYSEKTEWDIFKQADFETKKKFARWANKNGFTHKTISEMFGIGYSTYGNYLYKNNITVSNSKSKCIKRKPNKPMPKFSDWLKDNKKSCDDELTETFVRRDISCGTQEPKPNVIQLKQKSAWVCSSEKLPGEIGDYACVCITGVGGFPQRSRSFIRYDGSRWMVKGSEIVTHWLFIPEMPEQIAM